MFRVKTGLAVIFVSSSLCLADSVQPRAFTPQDRQNVEANCAAYPAAATLRERLVNAPDERLLTADDQWLVDFVPNPRAKRALFVASSDSAHGCPIHGGGRYVFKASADPFVPYRLTCSIGRESYPNEQFPDSGSLESPWDEQGWLDTRKTVNGEPNPTYDIRYYWNAHYAFWGRWMKLGPFMEGLAVAHLLDDNEDRSARAAHAAAVLLIRLAHVFPDMDSGDFDSYDWVKGFPFVVRIQDYVWEPSHTDRYTRTYDLIRGAIQADESLLRLDYGRTGTPWGDDPAHDYDGDGDVTTADLTLCIERDLLREYGRLYMDVPPTYGNATMVHQRTLSLLALVLDEPIYYEHARANLLDHIATNWFTNDGAYYEGSIPGYGLMCVRALRDASSLLRRFDADLPASRLVKGLLFTPSLSCLDRVLPNADDAGGVTLSKYTGRPPFRLGDYARGYLEYGDERLLRPLALSEEAGTEPTFESFQDLLNDLTEEKRARLAAALNAFEVERLPTTVTRSGYAVLRGGADVTPFDLFVTFDTYGGSHTHYDTFNLALYGFDYALVPDLGYPDDLRSPARPNWISHPLSHWTVTVNRASMDINVERARLTLLVDQPGFKAFAADSPSSYESFTSRYRRTVCLIDKPDGTPLVVDFFQVSGGKEHLYSFHGAAPDGAAGVRVAGGKLGDLSPFTTLQGMWHGEEVPYGKFLPDSEDACLAYVENVRPVHPAAGAETLKVSFPRGDQEKTQLDFWMPTSCADDFTLGEGRSCPTAHQRNVQLPYLIARSGSMDGPSGHASTFCAVVEPHQGQACVASVRMSETPSVEIGFKDGGQWRVEVLPNGVAFTRNAAGGTTTDSFTATSTEGVPIKSVDYDARTIALERSTPVAKGDLVIIENELGRNTFYYVDFVNGDGSIVLGDRWTDLRVAKGSFTGDRAGNHLRCDPRYPMMASAMAQCRGARLLDSLGDTFRVERVDSSGPADQLAQAIVMEGTDEDCEALVQREDKSFGIFDFGIGDTVKKIDLRVKE